MKIFLKILFRVQRRIYRKRVILSVLCAYAFTIVVLLNFHLKYTNDHFSQSLNVMPKISRSIKGLPDNLKDSDQERSYWDRLNDSKENAELQKQKEIAGQNVSSVSGREVGKKIYTDVQVIENILFSTQGVKARDEIWQNVTSDGKLYVFSAFYEVLDGKPAVRVLGLNGNMYLPKPYCQLQLEDGIVITVKGRVSMLPDHHEKEFRPVFFLCYLPDDRRPLFISLISQKQPELLNTIKIVYNDKMERNFTLCLSPLHFKNSVHYELIQWFELNKILGADYFFVYNYSTVGYTDHVLKHYVEEGWIKVIQWNLPDSDVHYNGQIAMINDCLFRNYNLSKFILNTDIDEFIVPRRGINSITSLIETLPQNYCEYNFRSSFLVSESKEMYEAKKVAKQLRLDVLLKLLRREYIFPKNVRSKYIANTSCVDTAGIHFNWKYKNDNEELQKYHVMPQDALLFHYRRAPLAKDVKEVEEKAVYKFHTELISNVKQRWRKINSEGKILL